MISVEAVAERLPAVVDEFALWPVVGGSYWLPVGPSMTSEEVGTVLCAALPYVDGPRSVEAAVRWLLDSDGWTLPGGLLVRDSAVTVPPGCCFGLEEWRDWVAVLSGSKVFLGHDPAPWVEFRDDGVLRLWGDGGLGDEPGEGAFVDLDAAVLRESLLGVQRDLVGFLGALGSWARRHAPGLADDLVSVADTRLCVRSPLF